VSSPPQREQPRTCSSDRDGSLDRQREPRAPPVEPRSRGERISAPLPVPRPVLPGVLEHVDERVPHLARTPEHVLVRPIAEHPPSPPPQPIERARDAPSPRRPLTNARRSSPSAIKCTWLPCTEKCTNRNPGLSHPLAKARRSERNAAPHRSRGNPRCKRNVTCTGWCLDSAALRACDSASGFAFGRPAPSRFPPRPPNASSPCRTRNLRFFPLMPTKTDAAPERLHAFALNWRTSSRIPPPPQRTHSPSEASSSRV
jgi:hypothetical protein